MNKEIQELMLLQAFMFDVLRNNSCTSIEGIQKTSQDLLDLVAKSKVASQAHRDAYLALSK
jgi:hypothetical protein